MGLHSEGVHVYHAMVSGVHVGTCNTEWGTCVPCD